MKQFLCPICKAPIVCSYVRSDLYFYQDKNNNVVRDTNNDVLQGIDPYLYFYCSNNMKDNIESLTDLPEFIEWQTEFNAAILAILQEEYLCRQ